MKPARARSGLVSFMSMSVRQFLPSSAQRWRSPAPRAVTIPPERGHTGRARAGPVRRVQRHVMRLVPRGLLARRRPRVDVGASSHLKPRATRAVPRQLDVRDEPAGRMAPVSSRRRRSAPGQVAALRETPRPIAAAVERHRRLALTPAAGQLVARGRLETSRHHGPTKEKNESRAVRITHWR